MCNQPVNIKETIIILFPFDIKNVYRAHLYGDYENFKDNVKMFFTKKLVDTQGSKICKNIFKSSDISISSNQNKIISNWILIDIENEVLFIKQMKLKGDFQNCSRYNFLWICYNFKLFSLCEFLSMETVNHDSKESYFKYLKDKINMEMSIKKERVRASLMNQIRNLLFNIMLSIILKLSTLSVRILPVTQYFNIAIHIDNYLNGFLWAIKSIKENNRVSIKVTNFLLSVLMDMLFGIIFLNWLNTKVSLDSSASLFLLTTESVVESIKSLINWLRGDPAGLKLNWAFNKILATFFSFHIEIWWTFLVYLKPAVKIIFQIFLKLGLLGLTFQASILADILSLVSFHVYCIHAYAAKLYNIQISALISLWRLFLGRKKNPLREKVDSCRYSPKQLFVGTLAFTILLFLLPTTLVYYIVFTSIKLLIMIIAATLMLVQKFNQTLPVYTTILWIINSPKIFAEVSVMPCNEVVASNFILVNVKPKIGSWWETVKYFAPDCEIKSSEFNFSAFFKSLLTGKHKISLSRK